MFESINTHRIITNNKSKREVPADGEKEEGSLAGGDEYEDQYVNAYIRHDKVELAYNFSYDSVKDEDPNIVAILIKGATDRMIGEYQKWMGRDEDYDNDHQLKASVYGSSDFAKMFTHVGVAPQFNADIYAGVKNTVEHDPKAVQADVDKLKYLTDKGWDKVDAMDVWIKGYSQLNDFTLAFRNNSFREGRGLQAKNAPAWKKKIWEDDADHDGKADPDKLAAPSISDIAKIAATIGAAVVGIASAGTLGPVAAAAIGALMTATISSADTIATGAFYGRAAGEILLDVGKDVAIAGVGILTAGMGSALGAGASLGAQIAMGAGKGLLSAGMTSLTGALSVKNGSLNFNTDKSYWDNSALSIAKGAVAGAAGGFAGGLGQNILGSSAASFAGKIATAGINSVASSALNAGIGAVSLNGGKLGFNTSADYWKSQGIGALQSLATSTASAGVSYGVNSLLGGHSYVTTVNRENKDGSTSTGYTENWSFGDGKGDSDKISGIGNFFGGLAAAGLNNAFGQDFKLNALGVDVNLSRLTRGEFSDVVTAGSSGVSLDGLVQGLAAGLAVTGRPKPISAPVGVPTPAKGTTSAPNAEALIPKRLNEDGYQYATENEIAGNADGLTHDPSWMEGVPEGAATLRGKFGSFWSGVKNWVKGTVDKVGEMANNYGSDLAKSDDVTHIQETGTPYERGVTKIFKDQFGATINFEAARVGIDGNILGGILMQETRGNDLMRFENHLFNGTTSNRYSSLFTNNRPDSWNGQMFRTNTNESWQDTHIGGSWDQSQTREKQAFNFASTLDQSAAIRSSSWGVGQVLGSSYATLAG
jgi:hypothetical protein